MTLPIIITENGCFGPDSDNMTILFSGTEKSPCIFRVINYEGKSRDHCKAQKPD